MSDHTDISLNIAVGGCTLDPAHDEAFKKQVGMILSKTIDCVKKFNSADYGYSGSDVKAISKA